MPSLHVEGSFEVDVLDTVCALGFYFLMLMLALFDVYPDVEPELVVGDGNMLDVDVKVAVFNDNVDLYEANYQKCSDR